MIIFASASARLPPQSKNKIQPPACQMGKVIVAECCGRVSWLQKIAGLVVLVSKIRGLLQQKGTLSLGPQKGFRVYCSQQSSASLNAASMAPVRTSSPLFHPSWPRLPSSALFLSQLFETLVVLVLLRKETVGFFFIRRLQRQMLCTVLVLKDLSLNSCSGPEPVQVNLGQMILLTCRNPSVPRALQGCAVTRHGHDGSEALRSCFAKGLLHIAGPGSRL